jgi:hypothetical protein
MTRALVVVAVLLAASLPARADDAKDLVGRWDHNLTDSNYVRFRADGTFTSVALVGSSEGKYRVLAGGVIELTTPGLIYGYNVGEMKYRLTGDVAEFQAYGKWVKYLRAK